MKTWVIVNAMGKAMTAPFNKWVDAIYIVAKLHRLGISCTMKGE
jgi:hypothetical protein